MADVEIDRSSAVTERAGSIGAIAYTERGRVGLPGELGPIDTPTMRALVAHELTHVAQQRRHVSAPDERSDDGTAMERQARTVEQLVAGGGSVPAVVPTFLRDRASVPTAAPLGVQRRAPDDWAGTDWSTTDLSAVEPGSDDDPFRWQEREGEPTGVDWDVRRNWAEDFESSHALTLQTVRDDRYQELVHAATATRPDGALTDVDDDAIRTQIETELPWQFGAPAGLGDPPRIAAVVTAAPVVSPSPSANVPAPSTPAELRFPARASQPAALESAPSERPAAVPTATLAVPSALADARPAIDATSSGLVTVPMFVQERHDRERELRHSLLLQKRQVAIDAGAHDDTVVSLDGDEIDRIRFIVDLELPAGDEPVEYLGLDDDASVTVAGRLGGVVDAASPNPALQVRAGRVMVDEGTSEQDDLVRSDGDAPAGSAVRADRADRVEQVDLFADARRDDPDEVDPFAAWEAMNAEQGDVTSTIDGADLGEAQGHARHPAIEGEAHADAELAAHVVDSLTEVDLELLTRRLYRRIRTMLRSELLIDRERAGSLADIR